MQRSKPIFFCLEQEQRVVGHGTGLERPPACDDTDQQALHTGRFANLPVVIVVLANAIGGMLLLSGMLILPHILAGLFY